MATMYLLLPLLVCSIPSLAFAADSINQSQSIRDGHTMVSGGGIFELGFFSPGSSTGRYVGIWYKTVPIKTYVWVANRANPINDTSGVLMINSTGSLILLSQNSSVVWSVSLATPAQNVILQLLDTGNLVLRDGNDVSNPEVYLWQSFDYPTDTFLSGMKMGKNLRTGHVWSLTSWKSPDDPSPGDITWGLENLDFPEMIGRQDSIKYTSSGPWVGPGFSSPLQQTDVLFSNELVSNQDEVCYITLNKNNSLLMRTVVNVTTSHLERSTWSEATQSWMIVITIPRNPCENYGRCGVYSKCQPDTIPYCHCLKGFSPKFPDKWAASDWSDGCVRNERLSYGTSDGFIKYNGLTLPDTTNTTANSSIDLKGCRVRCLRNSSCMAYSNTDVRDGGSGCAMWLSDVIDMRTVSDGGQDIYIRMPASEICNDNFKAWKVVVSVLVVGAVAVVLAAFFYIRKQLKGRRENHLVEDIRNDVPDDDELDFTSFDLATIDRATDNFSMQNKLGEGGFGPVYKGILADGKEIAVKRLSSSSTQGAKEFKNEVILIANLQHRNLVKLLGCCIHGEERMLIYEYMPNGSLDAFIFDQTRRKQLHWGKRFNIICGVARGLLYLHQDSRLRIIHRDLKASNVLLDNQMNPKISDFGMARMFGEDETEGNTKRVVGTYGYMAPEYAIDGLFSVKSDVFSFGVLVLETVSGRRNRGVHHLEHNLIGHAWKLYKEGKSDELIDPCLLETCCKVEILRCVHIALLCLQEYAKNRPSMASVVLMLSSEGLQLPLPKSPRFLADREQIIDKSMSANQLLCSNDSTFTVIEAR